jgi:hypothetical protein
MSFSKLCPTAPPSIQDGYCFFKVMIISLWNLLQYHSIVRWAIQAQWAEPLVISYHLPSLAPFCQAVSEEKIFLNSSQSETRIALGGHICWWNGTKWRNFIEDLT